jgi:hypothetical protein
MEEVMDRYVVRLENQVKSACDARDYRVLAEHSRRLGECIHQNPGVDKVLLVAAVSLCQDKRYLKEAIDAASTVAAFWRNGPRAWLPANIILGCAAALPTPEERVGAVRTAGIYMPSHHPQAKLVAEEWERYLGQVPKENKRFKAAAIEAAARCSWPGSPLARRANQMLAQLAQ